jgi:hypothetical protein
MTKLRLSAIAFALVALYGWANTKDFEDAQITEKHVAQATARKSELSLPLLYDATVTQSGPGQPPRTRFYTRSQR